MITRFWKSALACSALVASQPVWSQTAAQDSDSAEVAVSGSVARLCILGEPSRSLIDLGQMAQTSGAGVGRLASLPAQSVSLPGSFCNFAGSSLGVTASALVGTDGATPPAGFAKAVNFTATASGWGTGAVQGEPKLGTIDVALATFSAPANGLLVAGDYSGQVTVTLGPVAVSE